MTRDEAMTAIDRARVTDAQKAILRRAQNTPEGRFMARVLAIRQGLVAPRGLPPQNDI